MNESKQISDKIHLFDLDFTDQIRNHLYLIIDQDEAVLIDAHIGQAAGKVLEKIEEIIELDNLKTVLLTHGHMDHIGACPLLEEKTNASIAAHIADAQYIEEPWTQFVTLYQDFNISSQAYQDFITIAGGRGAKVTQPLHDGDTIHVGSLKLEIIHTPGHSPGSICIYEPETKTMFTGDVLIPSDWFSTMIGVFQDATKHIQSLKRLSEKDIEVLCPGHAPIRRGAGVQKEFQLHFDRYYEIEKWIPEILSDSDGMSLWEIHHRLADEILPPGIHEPGIGAVCTVRGFLNKLCFEGEIIQENGSMWRAA